MRNFGKGATLIEIMVVVSIIAVISGVVVADFPKIKLQLSLSRVVHIIVQDLKTARSLSGSGHQETTVNGDNILPKGYGVFIDLNAQDGNKKYIIYADVDGDLQYISGVDQPVREVDLSRQEPGIIIKGIHNANNRLSINFSPPNFATNISDLLSGFDSVEIVVGSDADKNIPDRIISVNKAGLIETK